MTTCEAGVLFRLTRNSAALVTGQTSAPIPASRRTLAEFSEVTPSPMWLIARLAAKFL